jgi:asparagine synthase (glutamine-hydrolysing)
MAARLRETTDSAGSDPLAADRTRHLAGLGNPLYQSTLEIADRCAAAFGLEARYPFFDRRLIEFCLGVPSEQKFAHGWTRWTMRRAMEGVLPPEIQWRGNKANLGPNYRRQLSRADAPVLDRAPLAALAPYVDVARAQALRARVLAQTETDAERVLVYRMTVLASWLADGAESRGALATVAPLAA